ncbi:MAG: hypothetical protein ILA06_09015 [Bacteroidaceae bacterium]|nr:hypothetical protein [Bacteroidaceae bacterium]
MQKTYVRPELMVQVVEIETFIAVSGPSPAGDEDFPTVEPDAPVKENAWGDTIFDGE